MRKDPQKALGDRVRGLRQKANLSQEALADACGLHRTYVGGVERGERNISLLNIVALSRALGVSPSSLLENIE
jgi:transcriptional regulator with XRE-family HTH domain